MAVALTRAQGLGRHGPLAASVASDQPDVLRPTTQASLDDAFDVTGIGRLREPVVGARLERGLNAALVFDRRQDDHRGAPLDVGQGTLQQLKAVELRHHDVRQDEIELALVQALQGLEPVRRDNAAVVQGFELRDQRASNGSFVVDNEDPGHGFRQTFHRSLQSVYRPFAVRTQVHPEREPDETTPARHNLGMRAHARLQSRLAQGPLLLSGGLGTELLRRGHATPLPLWSTAVLLEQPDAVRRLHADYVRAGAGLVTANTFRTARASVAPHGLTARALTRQAVELARAGARDAAPDGSVLVAGSLGPVADCYRPDLVPDEPTLRAEHGLHVGSLVAARVDLVLVETMNTIREASAALGAARAGLLPAMISFVVGAEGRLLSGESLADAIAAVEPFAPLAILVNCCAPSAATAALETLAACTTRPFGAYGNGAGQPDDEQGWRFEGGHDDAAYVTEARRWLAQGATVIGGCCGTGPETIQALCALLDQGATGDGSQRPGA